MNLTLKIYALNLKLNIIDMLQLLTNFIFKNIYLFFIIKKFTIKTQRSSKIPVNKKITTTQTTITFTNLSKLQLPQILRKQFG